MDRKNNKKDETSNPNRVRTAYLWNIIFLSALTIMSLVFALFVFFRLRTRGTDGLRKMYSDAQIRKIREDAAERERQVMLAKMQNALESGKGTTLMLREAFTNQIIVVSEGKYYFYPVDENVEKTPVPSGMISCEDGKTVEYSGTYPEMTFLYGALISDDNGRIDWGRLAASDISEVTIRAGTLKSKKFSADGQFERNCRKARENNIPAMICVEVEDPSGQDVIAETADRIEKMASENGLADVAGSASGDSGTADSAASDSSAKNAAEEKPGASPAAAGGEPAAPEESKPTVVLRIRNVEKLAENEKDRGKWTETVSSLCGELEARGFRVMVGGSIQTFAAQIDISEIAGYDRWLVDHEMSVSFPYSISCWEYTRDGRLGGVPGESLLYAKFLIGEQ